VEKSRQAELLREEDVLSASRVENLFPDARILAALLRTGVLQPDGGGAFRVGFVGVAVAGDRSFQVIPKIFEPSTATASTIMRQVIRALRRYGRWQPNETPFLHAKEGQSEINAVAIADWIMRDYLANGIYRRFCQREEVSGDGVISWRHTIERMNPIISNGRPIYVDTVTRSTTRDNEHFVSRLHRHIIEKARDAFGHLLGYEPFTLDHEQLEPLNDTPPTDLCQNKVQQEMRVAYSDRTMRLLPMLLAWLSAIKMAVKLRLALYGVNAFYAVWEQACSTALGNERKRWQAYIPEPTWRSAGGQAQTARTFQPDIVTRVGGQGGDYLLIADAKYYQLSMPPALSGQPGVNDIAKQLWYERSLADAARMRGFAGIRNIFVVPGPECVEHFWSDGEVRLAGLPENKVDIKRLSGLHALKAYADGSPLNAALVRSVVV
jgi:hypothetical protein